MGIGLLGFGTVGGGLYTLLRGHGKGIQTEYGVDFDVKKILVRDIHRKRSIAIPKGRGVTSFQEILNDPSIDIVVEVMGGEKPAGEYIVAALKAGKHVITANKSLMAKDGEKLVARARQYGRYFGFLGAVTGCHQFCSYIANSVIVRSLVGVFNSTSNFILTEMEAGHGFDEAVKLAQARGYAESDPASDVDGIDTRNKLVILSRLAFGVFLDREKIPMSGIRNITKLDMEYARKLGYAIKLLGVARPTPDGKIEASVHPSFVPLSHQLASVKGIENGLQVNDDFRGAQVMVAKGAGADPTAVAILRDLIAMSQKESIIWTAGERSRFAFKYAKRHSTVHKFYVRMTVENRPGVLASVLKVLGRHDVNITSVLQHDATTLKAVPVVIMCGPSEEAIIRKAVKEIESLHVIDDTSQIIQVEDSLCDADCKTNSGNEASPNYAVAT